MSPLGTWHPGRTAPAAPRPFTPPLMWISMRTSRYLVFADGYACLCDVITPPSLRVGLSFGFDIVVGKATDVVAISIGAAACCDSSQDSTFSWFTGASISEVELLSLSISSASIHCSCARATSILSFATSSLALMSRRACFDFFEASSIVNRRGFSSLLKRCGFFFYIRPRSRRGPPAVNPARRIRKCEGLGTRERNLNSPVSLFADRPTILQEWRFANVDRRNVTSEHYVSIETQSFTSDVDTYAIYYMQRCSNGIGAWFDAAYSCIFIVFSAISGFILQRRVDLKLIKLGPLEYENLS
ncbi:hypothetical protein EVAR_47868_1 [Eumeta japonica]|uniref:Uncharacterized protein n=1 Tax=Eumeta variegata TaxID=151549 RepID=A0A4C1ZUF9_EUMVA|nr:hypothetical protein EVAR_47868_1 [Eumeta japonica]